MPIILLVRLLTLLLLAATVVHLVRQSHTSCRMLLSSIHLRVIRMISLPGWTLSERGSLSMEVLSILNMIDFGYELLLYVVTSV